MLRINDLSITIEHKKIVKGLNIDIQQGEIVSIIGPNGSGKSTALKAISRMIPSGDKTIFIDGKDLAYLKSKEISKQMSVLFQSNDAPADLTVKELIEYGRTPHKKWFEQLKEEDHEIVEWAIQKTNLEKYRDRLVVSLSGGEAQRAWIAMSLAQRPKILLLDEPTTYLDIAHQLQLLELIVSVNRELGMTIVMVLHDLNQASIYSDKVCVIQEGHMIKYGTSEEVMTKALIRDVYNVDCDIDRHAKYSKPRINLIGIAE